MKPYPTYKDSGIAWIGQIPSHWRIKGLRSYLSMVSEKGHGDKQLLSVTREQGVIVRNTESKEENHNFIPDDLNGYKLVKKGQFAINKMKSWQGSYGVSEYEGIVSPAYFVCDLTFPFKPFFSMAIRSKAYIPFFTQYSKGIRVDQWDLSPLALKSIPFIEPPADEQEAIVRYITEKSEKIDRYIAEQERLLAALDELRAAEIARAVTRGLNPDAPLRDSGIDWIGQIPAHWETARLKDVSTINDEVLLENTPKDFIIDYVEIGDVTLSKGVINKTYYKFKDAPSRARRKTQIGDVIVSTVRTYLRAIAKITEENLIVSTGFAVIRGNGSINSSFLALLLSCENIISWIIKESVGISYPAISATNLHRCPIILPPLSEQRAIVEYLDEKTANIDRMKADIEKQIGLLKEYKQRMISDAVTGKIDVRE